MKLKDFDEQGLLKGMTNEGLASSKTGAYSEFIAISKYAKWMWQLESPRRETWGETVGRYFGHMETRYADNEWVLGRLPLLKEAVYSLNAMPSMRGLASAGPALDRDEVPVYNCAFVGMDNQVAFDEIMYVLMNGTGVGFSVEKHFIDKLPAFEPWSKPMKYYLRGEQEDDLGRDFLEIPDDKEGWSLAFRHLLESLYEGKEAAFDFSMIRPEGTPLRTFGGRASGPKPLLRLFKFTEEIFANARKRAARDGNWRLTSIEIADIVCMTALIVVVGGVRRSALLCLTDADDKDMAAYKTGEWYKTQEHRGLANISAAYNEPPELSFFMKEWTNLYDSYSGERGIFSRYGAKNKLVRFGRRDVEHTFGVNPCGEQILRPQQFCNLSEVVVRPTDDIETIRNKVYVATALGTLQASMTRFMYLRDIWRQNTEDERLLGVSMTGVYEHPILGDPYNPELPAILEDLRDFAVEVNQAWAHAIGIKPAGGVTTMKPSGTVSQLVNASPGVNRRPIASKHYIRRVRADRKDPLAQMMIDQGFPYETIYDGEDIHGYAFTFPMINPAPSLPSAVQDFDLWRVYNQHWSEHAVSTTLNYTDDEFMALGQKVFNNLNDITGVAFLPFDGHIYQHAPYEGITEEQYEELLARMPEFDFGKLVDYERDDTTSSSHEFACAGGACEIVDLT